MLQEVPITFEHEGKLYEGVFSPVSGLGQQYAWYLTIDKRYYGTLHMVADNWVFNPNPKNESMRALSDYFGMYVVGWHC